MKKKYTVTSKDKKDWLTFTKHLENLYDKDADSTKPKTTVNKITKLDLHGLSLEDANKKVKKFIIKSFEDGYKKLLIITGKGLRFKSHNNPYLSEKLNVLKYSVPEYITNNENLINKISKISKASLKDGGEGAIYIFLKNKKKFIK